MEMTPKIRSFVLHFGEMGSRWGFNRTVGQLLALIVMSEDPINSDDLAAALSVSRGNVSMGLKELQAWRLIKPVHIPGDRKEYYVAAGDIWEMGKRVMEERRKRELEPTLSLLRDLLLDPSSASQDQFSHERMEEIHDLLELVSSWSGELQDMSHEKLKTLMRLGSGVGKVLDIKDKLFKNDQESAS